MSCGWRHLINFKMGWFKFFFLVILAGIFVILEYITKQVKIVCKGFNIRLFILFLMMVFTIIIIGSLVFELSKVSGATISDNANYQNYDEYVRSDYGTSWSTDSSGINTRNRVLIRDNLYKDSLIVIKGVVKKGYWQDPYTGKYITDPLQLDIDHVVPVKEAHISGASSWDNYKKHLYYNYTGDRYTLKPVSLSANRSKGDNDPSKWLPKFKTCDYLIKWLYVKSYWNLTMDSTERKFVFNYLNDSCDCNLKSSILKGK